MGQSQLQIWFFILCPLQVSVYSQAGSKVTAAVPSLISLHKIKRKEETFLKFKTFISQKPPRMFSLGYMDIPGKKKLLVKGSFYTLAHPLSRT